MHKEQNLGLIFSGAEDLPKIRISLGKCIHPLQVDLHPSNILINIYTGEESDQSDNVNKATELWAKQENSASTKSSGHL